MASQYLEQAIEEMVRIPPILHRKLHRGLFKVVLEEVGANIAPHYMMIMRLIQESGPLSSSEIGETLSIAKSQMTHSIDKLIALGMVEREHGIEDRRTIQISLTDQGCLMLEQIDRTINNNLKERLAILSDDELGKLAESFRNIAEILSKIQ